MPLFEYECRGCGKQFEHLTRGGEPPTCKFCQGTDLQKLLSVFAVSSGGTGSDPAPFPASGACGSCGDPRGPGSCSMN
jgi:putative FmdB family regulatory protein